MAAFHFRLETSLKLSEQILEDNERILAGEIHILDQLTERRDQTRQSWQEALSGQEEAGRVKPGDLGKWQVYAYRCHESFRETVHCLQLQEKQVDQARQKVIEANRELEKFKKLKEKQWMAYLLGVQKQEQMALDEAGQMLFFRGKSEGCL